MLAHEKVRKSLASKSKGRGKSSVKGTKKPASPPKASADVDLDNRFAAHYDRMAKDMDDRMELLSSSLLGQIKSMLANVQPNPSYSEDTSAFPGQSGDQTEPEPPQPDDKLASARSHESLVCERGTGAQVIRRVIQVFRQVAVVPGDIGNTVCMRMIMLMIKTLWRRLHWIRAFARLVNYIYEPETAASTKPRCKYESYFSVSDPPEPSRKFMKLYPRVS